MTSGINYIRTLLNDFIAAYLIFAIFLTFGTFALVWWSIQVVKRNMWDTNIILKILPFESLKREERENIKAFFKA